MWFEEDEELVCDFCGRDGVHDPTFTIQYLNCSHKMCDSCEFNRFRGLQTLKCLVCGAVTPRKDLSKKSPEEREFELERSVRKRLTSM